MNSLRSTEALAWCAMVALAAGCGGRPARVLVPSQRPSAPLESAARPGSVHNLPPTVRITCPEPSALAARQTHTATRILWEGSDPDGPTSPVEYKFILLGPGSEFPVALALSNPDSLRRYYAGHPLGPWAGWDSTGADTRSVVFSSLTPDQEYLFAVIAFDEAGAYSPVFDLSVNLLHMRVSLGEYRGPIITLIGPGFEYRYPTGGYCPCPSAEVPTQVPENRRVTFRWLADASEACGDIRSYRWAVDIADVFDETPRTDEETDVQHWSRRSLATSATIGPFALSPPPEGMHRLYVEAEDNLGFRSLGIIRLEVVPNRPPECERAAAELSESWPPDRELARVRISGVIDPDGDPVAITVTGVTQDEPLDGVGDGQTCPDAVIEDGVAFVRRERSGTGNGRVYTIWFDAVDGNGGICSGTADVCIPRGDARNRDCIKDNLVVNSVGPCERRATGVSRSRPGAPSPTTR